MMPRILFDLAPGDRFAHNGDEWIRATEGDALIHGRVVNAIRLRDGRPDHLPPGLIVPFAPAPGR
jgi:hypothetical protein